MSSSWPSASGRAPIPRVLHYTQVEGASAFYEACWRNAGMKEVRFYAPSDRDAYVKQHRPGLHAGRWQALSDVEQADAFRYLVVHEEGGYYMDSDAWPARHVARWLATFGWEEVPAEAVGFLLGVELPDGPQPSPVTPPNPFQICQFAFGAAAGCPLLQAVLALLERVELEPPDPIVRTGPGLWTAAILRFLRTHGQPPSDADHPACILPIPALEERGQMLTFEADGGSWSGLLLPYRAFGFHPAHTGRHRAEQDHLVRHEFRGRWRQRS